MPDASESGWGARTSLQSYTRTAGACVQASARTVGGDELRRLGVQAAFDQVGQRVQRADVDLVAFLRPDLLLELARSKRLAQQVSCRQLASQPVEAGARSPHHA